jgi:hypothetical protein
VHLQTSLVQSFVLLFQKFEEVVQIIALKRFGGAPHYNQLAPLPMLNILLGMEEEDKAFLS